MSHSWLGNLSTLVILIDLFFFIYVISLIAGPVSFVFLAAVPLVVVVGLGIQPFLARVTKGSVESGMNKQAVLVETLNGLETVNATGSGKLMRKRYEDALENQADGGNKLRALSMFIINFAASVQQYAQVAAIFFGVCEGQMVPDWNNTRGADGSALNWLYIIRVNGQSPRTQIAAIGNINRSPLMEDFAHVLQKCKL